MSDKKEMEAYMQLMLSFAKVQKNMVRFIQKSAVKKGLSIPQYSILMTIIGCNEMTQKNIGEKTVLPKSTLSQAIDGLVKEGYLDRQQVEDNRRETLLALSTKGRALVEELHLQEDGLHQAFKEASEQFTPDQVDELLEAHGKISAYLTQVELEVAAK
ncbi:MarR family transcriptional regulator [Planococcus antarcticus DSM 14505]|uniref:MarR family transcriptional regulator n=1 Tax=Planococcus antarcticus DSM 14505 TaxID=1185653 RepID=A0A1C7DKV0_9BACL|nr:MarR family transcriptional regulator [Planococcus antarcticus]ANU12008.1 MarR family transcriptional regulator [Planococcus antarcticus DSM 14505]EIM07990.1 MarR family transcriptional regulator [Planococcus antarcticus DSM 14505]